MQDHISVRIGRLADLYQLTVNGNHIGFGIDARAQLTHDPPVDSDSTCHDHVFGWP
jgi:hypothetical protein